MPGLPAPGTLCWVALSPGLSSPLGTAPLPTALGSLGSRLWGDVLHLLHDTPHRPQWWPYPWSSLSPNSGALGLLEQNCALLGGDPPRSKAPTEGGRGLARQQRPHQPDKLTITWHKSPRQCFIQPPPYIRLGVQAPVQRPSGGTEGWDKQGTLSQSRGHPGLHSRGGRSRHRPPRGCSPAPPV